MKKLILSTLLASSTLFTLERPVFSTGECPILSATKITVLNDEITLETEPGNGRQTLERSGVPIKDKNNTPIRAIIRKNNILTVYEGKLPEKGSGSNFCYYPVILDKNTNKYNTNQELFKHKPYWISQEGIKNFKELSSQKAIASELRKLRNKNKDLEEKRNQLEKQIKDLESHVFFRLVNLITIFLVLLILIGFFWRNEKLLSAFRNTIQQIMRRPSEDPNPPPVPQPQPQPQPSSQNDQIIQEPNDCLIENNRLTREKIEFYGQSTDIHQKSNRFLRVDTRNLMPFIKQNAESLKSLQARAQNLFDYLHSIAPSLRSIAQSLAAMAQSLPAMAQSLQAMDQSLQAMAESRERTRTDSERIDNEGGDNDQNGNLPSAPPNLNDKFYSDLISNFNSNDCQWFDYQISEGKLKKVNITQESALKKHTGYEPDAAIFELNDGKAPFLIYEATGHIWLIPNKTDENWSRAVTKTSFTGNSKNTLVLPAEVEIYTNNMWKIKQKGEFQ